MPLCSLTKSGKLIDRLIKKVGDKFTLCHEKTNLYDIDHYPGKEQKELLAIDWHERIQPGLGDVIILLGQEVHLNFLDTLNYKIVKLPHPASIFSHTSQEEYIQKALEKIETVNKNRNEYRF